MENHAMQELDLEEVRTRAYLFWEERGRPEGSADEDWFRAEQSVRDEQSVGDEQSVRAEQSVPDDRARPQPPALRRRPSRPAGKAAAARAAS
ncbi:MAG TPA: DUF2934 domain-containing protein [Candidatus Acidoferrales bacterium]|nr:DUF2934 domain-containing protein [Candidatus Acidoferrales bacterium]